MRKMSNHEKFMTKINTFANKRGCCTTQYSQNFDDKDKSIKMQNIDYQIQKLVNSNLYIIESNKNELCNKHVC